MMLRLIMRTYILFLPFLFVFIQACKRSDQQPPNTSFRLLTAEQTGLEFNNELIPTTTLNIFHYMYFYNGGGVAIADFNKDGRLDIYFTANQKSNSLYLNKGNLTFKEVTDISRTTGEGGWSTGVTVTDINQDGWLDIYVNQVGGFRGLEGRNRLYVWKSLTPDSVPVYEERASEYGLDFQGFGTQAGFFDYDLDGDLDLFQLNHSVHHNGTFGQRKEFEGTYHATAGDRLYRNDNGKFVDVTAGAGILGTVVGYGLGMVFSDINSDGWPDIYITNDFHENDYLYINQQNGTFREELNDRMRHTSRFSMGVDIADINNDGSSEIFTLDMHPEDPYILKSSLGEDDYGAFHFKLSYGYNHQYARNTLQLNNRDNTFSEIGIYSGVYATDWSWACLFFDFDHDGFNDIFVSNGIPKRMNDIDYVNFASHDEIQWKIRMDEMEETDLAVQEKLPEIKIPNKFYWNTGQLAFNDYAKFISDDLPSFSNGAAYGDMDNDGDLDLVVNNINDNAFLYENTLTPSQNQHYISIRFHGPAENPAGIGARIIAFKKNETIVKELFPARGYLSFVAPELHVGLGDVSILDSIIVIWPDHSYQKIAKDSIDKTIDLYYTKGLGKYQFQPVQPEKQYKDVTKDLNINFVHEENEFVEFNREQLIPHMTSTEGPALAVSDINGDGLQDFFVGSSKRKVSAFFIQTGNGTFVEYPSSALHRDSIYEDVDAVFLDIDNDHDADLVVASGGNEYAGTSAPMQQRIYLNDGSGNFNRDSTALPEIFMTSGCVAATDFNKDGFVDLFFGGRAIPWNYGKVPNSYLLQNDGYGKFKDVTSQLAARLSSAGMVKDAEWCDMDQNGYEDLLLAVEWGPVQIFYQDAQNNFIKHEIQGTSGMWNFILPIDPDGDGDQDFIAGNLGLNSKLKASPDRPVRLYINDFDNNGQVEQIMTYFMSGEEIVFPTHREIMRQLPSLKKNFLKAKDFAKADLATLVDGHMDGTEVLTAVMFHNSYFENRGTSRDFKHHPLPAQLQFSCLRAGAYADINKDGQADALLAGNFHENNIELGRYDADFGTALISTGKNILQSSMQRLGLDGQIRRIVPIYVLEKQCFLVAANNGPLRLITFDQ